MNDQVIRNRLALVTGGLDRFPGAALDSEYSIEYYHYDGRDFLRFQRGPFNDEPIAIEMQEHEIGIILDLLVAAGFAPVVWDYYILNARDGSGETRHFSRILFARHESSD